MKKLLSFAAVAVILSGTLLNCTQPTFAQSAPYPFTYQGRLNSGTNPANGNYDFSFALFDNNGTNSGQLGSTLTFLDIGVTNGLFTVVLDFGANFPGANRWLAIGVRTNGAATYTGLSPLQELTAAPYAFYATNAGSATSATSAATATTANNVASGIAITNATITNSSYGGDGGSLTNLNATELTNGTVADARLSTNVALLAKTQTFTGANNFSNNISISTASGPQALYLSGNSIGGFGSPLALMENKSTATNTSPVLRVVGYGAANNGVLSVSCQATASGLIAEFGNGNAFVSQLDINGNWTATSFAGIGSGLTSLNASQLNSGVVPTTVLPGFQSSANYSTVNGGQQNTIALISDHSAIGGGWMNTIGANDYEGTIAGGYQNKMQANAAYAFIGGGEGNIANNAWAGIGGGNNNTNNGNAGTIAGGQINLVGNCYQGTVGGGYDNNASGNYATVPGGFQNVASGVDSFAAGQQAQATNQGAFVWADSSNAVFTSTANDQFNVRANGGARFVTGGIGMTVDDVQISAHTISDTLGLSIQAVNTLGLQSQGSMNLNANSEMDITTFGSMTLSSPEMEIDGLTVLQSSGSLSIDSGFIDLVDGSIQMSSDFLEVGQAICNGAIWLNGSDRNSKEDFSAVDSRHVLDKVLSLPISEWKYKVDENGGRHLGPMAQDFHAAFGLNGTDDKHIATVDEEGVALAAIQGLNEKLNEKDAEIQSLRKELDEQKTLNQRTTERFDQLEKAVARLVERSNPVLAETRDNDKAK